MQFLQLYPKKTHLVNQRVDYGSSRGARRVHPCTLQGKQQHNSSSWSIMGTLRSAVFLALCAAVSNAFVAMAPRFTPGQQASAAGLGAPMAVVSRPLDAGGAFSRISDSDAAEAEKRPPRVSFAEGHAGLCSPLYAFNGAQVRACYLPTHFDQTKPRIQYTRYKNTRTSQMVRTRYDKQSFFLPRKV